MFFVLSQAWNKEKILSPLLRIQTSDLQIPHSDALPLSHRDSTVSKVYYKVCMTHVLHTARISNVNKIMFVDGNKRDGDKRDKILFYIIKKPKLLIVMSSMCLSFIDHM